MIYTQRNTQIFSFSVYTVLFTLKNATQYTLYTQKTILHFRIPDEDRVVFLPVLHGVRHELNVAGVRVVVLVDDAAVAVGPVQIRLRIRFGGLELEQVAAGRLGDVVGGFLRVAGRRIIDDERLAALRLLRCGRGLCAALRRCVLLCRGFRCALFRRRSLRAALRKRGGGRSARPAVQPCFG